MVGRLWRARLVFEECCGQDCSTVSPRMKHWWGYVSVWGKMNTWHHTNYAPQSVYQCIQDSVSQCISPKKPRILQHRILYQPYKNSAPQNSAPQAQRIIFLHRNHTVSYMWWVQPIQFNPEQNYHNWVEGNQSYAEVKTVCGSRWIPGNSATHKAKPETVNKILTKGNRKKLKNSKPCNKHNKYQQTSAVDANTVDPEPGAHATSFSTSEIPRGWFACIARLNCLKGGWFPWKFGSISPNSPNCPRYDSWFRLIS